MNKFIDFFRSLFKSHWKDVVFALFIGLAVWLPRGIDLDVFVTIDEPPWLHRSANFYYSMAQKDYANTSPMSPDGNWQIIAPGLVTMWAETLAFLIEFPQYRVLDQGIIVQQTKFENILLDNDIEPLQVLVRGRQILTVWNTIVLVTAFFVARKLIGLWPSVLAFIFIAFEPYYIALTKIAHLDGPLAGIMLLSILAFIGYAYDGKKMRLLLLSAVAAGVAWLTKFPGLILVPVVGVISSHLFIQERREYIKSKVAKKFLWLPKSIKYLIIWGVVGLITLTIFWPEMWVAPLSTLSDYLFLLPKQHTRRSVEQLLGKNLDKNEISFNWAFANKYIIFYIWRATPSVLLGLIAALIAYIRKVTIFNNQKIRQTFISLVLYSTIYLFAIAYATTEAHRYLIPIYLTLDIIAAMGWMAFVFAIKDKIIVKSFKYFPHLIIVLVAGLQIFLAVRTHPYYFSYFNPLMGGSEQAGLVLKKGIGLGEGLDQAAEYLSNKPNYKELKIKTWYRFGPFSYFYSGNVRGTAILDGYSEETILDLADTDYLVTYVNQWNRFLPKRLIVALDSITPEHVIWINEIEYVRIYKISEFPESFFDYLRYGE